MGHCCFARNCNHIRKNKNSYEEVIVLKIKYNPMFGIALLFEPNEISDGCIFLQTMADGFQRGENSKMQEVGDIIDNAVKSIKNREKGYFF